MLKIVYFWRLPSTVHLSASLKRIVTGMKNHHLQVSNRTQTQGLLCTMRAFYCVNETYYTHRDWESHTFLPIDFLTPPPPSSLRIFIPESTRVQKMQWRMFLGNDRRFERWKLNISTVKKITKLRTDRPNKSQYHNNTRGPGPTTCWYLTLSFLLNSGSNIHMPHCHSIPTIYRFITYKMIRLRCLFAYYRQ